jgi:hypothetical protein
MLELSRLPQNEDQQSIVCLMQQIELYKELLAQVTYQNQLLSRDITIKQNHPMNTFGGMQGMNYHHMSQMAGMGFGGQAMGGNPISAHGIPQGLMGSIYFFI